MITFNSKQCMMWCLNSSHIASAVSEEEVQEVNLITRFSNLQAKTGKTANDQSVTVKKLSAATRVPTKGSTQVAGHHLYADELAKVPRSVRAIVATGIGIGLPHNTYGRIAPRASLAGKHQLITNAGVIDAYYTGQVKVVLVNLGD